MNFPDGSNKSASTAKVNSKPDSKHRLASVVIAVEGATVTLFEQSKHKGPGGMDIKFVAVPAVGHAVPSKARVVPTFGAKSSNQGHKS